MSFLKNLFGSHLLTEAGQAIRRFPLANLAALAGTALSIVFMHWQSSYWEYGYGVDQNYQDPEFLLSYITAAVFAVPLFLAFDVFAESRKFKATWKTAVRILGIVVV